MLVDTIGPRLSLLGGESVTIAVGSTFNDVGAIATDLSFDSDIIVYSTDSVDTSRSHTVTISYTAPDDDLGNSGETIPEQSVWYLEPSLNSKKLLMQLHQHSILVVLVRFDITDDCFYGNRCFFY